MPHTQEEYSKHDHSHCWESENPPCGIKGKHRCCLCEMPQENLTNGGKPHVCGEIAIHDTPLKGSLNLCSKCNMAVDNPQEELRDARWPKLRDFIVERVHKLVQGEVSRVREEDLGAIRKDGGRRMNEEIVIRGIVESIDNYVLTVVAEREQAVRDGLLAEFERIQNNGVNMSAAKHATIHFFKEKLSALKQ